MPRETITSADSKSPNQIQVGWGRDAEYVQVATNDGREHSGESVMLTRRSINDLICKLRRARDQAFGRDE